MMGRFTIAQRIYAAFSVLVVLLIVVGAAGYLGLQSTGGLFAGYRSAAASSLAIRSVVEQISVLRQLDSAYRLEPSAELVEEFTLAHAEAAIRIDEARMAFALDPAALEVIEAVALNLDEFAAAYQRGAQVQADREAHLSLMQLRATKARSAIQDVVGKASNASHAPSIEKAGAASDAMLRMLLHGERYALVSDIVDYDRMPPLGQFAKGVIKGLVAVLNMSLPDLAPTAQKAMDEIDPYLAAASKLKDATDERGLLRATLDSLGPQMQQQLGEVSARVTVAQTDLGIAADVQVDAIGKIVIAVGAFALIFGIGVAFVIARWLSRSISGMAGSMHRLAEGDLDIALDSADRGNELGQMAQALQIFRDNLEAVRAMDEQKQAAAQADARRRTLQDDVQAEVSRVVEAAVAGDFSVRIDRRFGSAEHDSLVASINQLMETVDRGLLETGSVLAAFAQADLTQRMTGEYSGAFAALKDNMNQAAEKFSDVLRLLQSTSRSIKTATGELLSGANDLSGRTSRQAATIEETSASAEAMSGNVAANADKAEEASRRSSEASTMADQGGQSMTAATEAMERIRESSSRISNIIGLIDDIAFQTNLLALNASVEAARAGEAGKGFAVVAVEVRRLAQSAAEASSQVKALIEQSSGEVKNGSKLVEKAAAQLASILTAVRESSGLMQGISVASREQASAIAEITTATRQLDEMTQQNAALVEEINNSIEQTERQAAELDGIVEHFVVAPDDAALAPHPASARRSRLELAESDAA